MASKKPLPSSQKVMNLVQTPETVVGAIVVVAVLVIGANTLNRTQALSQPSTSSHPAQEATPVTEPEVVAPEKTVESSPAPLAAIAVLADTSAGEVITAQSGDTFWKIARRICGAGIEGYRIQEENGYSLKVLHPGDQIIVTCN